MTKPGFLPTDDLYAAAVRTRAAVQDLHVAAHYGGCKREVSMIAEGGFRDGAIQCYDIASSRASDIRGTGFTRTVEG